MQFTWMSVSQGLYLIAASVDRNTSIVLTPWKGLWSSGIVLWRQQRYCCQAACLRLISLQRTAPFPSIIHFGRNLALGQVSPYEYFVSGWKMSYHQAFIPFCRQGWYLWPFEKASGPPVESAPLLFAVQTISSEQNSNHAILVRV